MDTNNNATTNSPNSANPAPLTSTPTPTAKKTELDQSSSTASFDAAMRSEASFGLSQFMTESPPFTCSLKARYSDFVVQEISKVDGSVASPLSSDHDNIKKVNEDREMRKEEKNDVWKLSEEERLAKFEEELKAVVTFEDVEGLKSFLEEKREPYKLCLAEDKAVRGKVHGLVRLYLSVPSDTLEGSIRLLPASLDPYSNASQNNQKNDKGGDKKRGKKRRAPQPWPKDLPQFLKFILTKSNSDTMPICSMLNATYAGTKDKRGVTSQFCTIQKGYKQAVCDKTKRMRDVAVTSFEYIDAPLSLGDLTGNRFTITLRNCNPLTKIDDRVAFTKELKQTLGDVMSKGFVNYYGLQRFGKFLDNVTVGVNILKQDFEGAVGVIMSPKPDEYSNYADGRKMWAESDKSADAAKKCERILRGKGMFNENKILKLRSLDKSWEDCISGLARNMRLMYLHSVQSLVWNKAASKRVELGCKVVKGDLVEVAAGVEEGKSMRENKTIVEVKEGEEDKYNIYDIVMPLPGNNVVFPEHSRGFYEEILEEQGLTMDMFKDGKKENRLGGDYRKVWTEFKNGGVEVIQYDEQMKDLYINDFMKFQDLNSPYGSSSGSRSAPAPSSGRLTGVVVSFELSSSCYATSAIREICKGPVGGEFMKNVSLG
ncbi:hypothetical protein TrLO_g14225 [Triparma laevis f. longispina]|uniref:TRUD domain-containing protein n=1 Tax=Triparma laevis f. longispina TaxID=1714387 RepID=A0A9W7C6J7_9STRA|nr:hypothetical protein TrLO_g14225 [Triparma laevis f. longispina]